MECVPSLDKRNNVLRCACLKWGTAGYAKERHSIRKEGRTRHAVAAGEWFEDFLLQSTIPTEHNVPENVAVHAFTTERPWSSP